MIMNSFIFCIITCQEKTNQYIKDQILANKGKFSNCKRSQNFNSSKNYAKISILGHYKYFFITSQCTENFFDEAVYM